MIVLKFGGTSLATPAVLKSVASIIKRKRTEGRIFVVVSACGDTTDHLVASLEQARAGKWKEARATLDGIAEYHRHLLSTLASRMERKPVSDFLADRLRLLADYLEGVSKMRDATPRAHDFVIGHGEQFSVAIMTALLKSQRVAAEAVDAMQAIITDDLHGQAAVNMALSSTRLKKLLKGKKPSIVSVMGGFIGATEEGTPTTLGRGGSDFSAAIVAEIMRAKRLEIWTDVDGVMSADPSVVPDAFPLPRLNFAEAKELAFFGAKVIHPKAIAPVERRGIPLLIKNTLHPHVEGTLITKSTSKKGEIKGITSIKEVSLIMLEGSGIIGIRGVAGRMFSALARRGINIIMIAQASSEQSVCCAVASHEAQAAVKELKAEFDLELARRHVQGVRHLDDVVVIAVVGEGTENTPGIAGRLFSALGRNSVNVIAIAQGALHMNISVAIDPQDHVRALNLVHGAFHLSPSHINLFVVGKGRIGSMLLEQIRAHREKLRESMGIDLRVIGVADSQHYIYNRSSIDLKQWKDQLKKSKEEMNMEKLGALLSESGLENLIVADATASAEVAKWYPLLFRRGISIVTPNKKANTQPLRGYDKLQTARESGRAQYFYEATVGAGLPIISTLRDLIDSGDEVKEIQGIFSGTLSYIFSMLREGTKLSDAVLEAMRRGYTEPDPRDDLCGADVMRKLLILAREMGRRMEASDIEVDNLVPTRARTGSLEKFLKMLPLLNDRFSGMVRSAQEQGSCLQYVGRLTKGKAFVGVMEVALDSPLATLKPGDNIIIFKTLRYDTNPLIVKGPGAGPEVTAGGVFADILRTSQLLLK